MSVATDRFYVILIGQTVASIAQIFVLGVSPNIAAVWFGPDEVSLACSIGVFGGQVEFFVIFKQYIIQNKNAIQIGVALGFLIPPIMVKDHDNLDEIGADLSVMLYAVAGYCTVLLCFVLFGSYIFMVKFQFLRPNVSVRFPNQASPSAKQSPIPYN